MLSTAEDDLREELLPNQISEDELSRALEVSPRTLHRWGLPFRKVGHRRYYDKEEVRKELKRRGRAGTSA